MAPQRFRDRADAARQLAEELKKLDLHDPIVLGIPRGGVLTAAALAQELGAEMNIVLARKLRHPFQPELAIGSVTEAGEVYLNERVMASGGIDEDYLNRERENRYAELKQRKELFRKVCPAARLEDRSVIITDDGIATGSTMLAAVPVVKAQHPREVIVAVPVAPPDRLEPFREQCDHVIYLEAPSGFMSIGEFYEDFRTIEDEEVSALLRDFAQPS